MTEAETAREWRTVDKGAWPAGPWHDEPDKKQWRDAETGFACLVVRNPVGALCGYVGVEPGHPLYGVDYSVEVELTAARRKMLDRPVGNASPILLLLACGSDEGKQRLDVLLDVHGGVTFSAGCQKSADPSRGVCHVPEDGRPDEVWWFGFDCSHCDDLAPGMDFRFRETARGEYRDLAYVEAEVAKLARQLAGWSA